MATREVILRNNLGDVVHNETQNIPEPSALQFATRDKIDTGINLLSTAHSDLGTLIANWDALDTAGVKAALKDEVLPDLKLVVRGLELVARELRNAHDTSPDLS